MQEFQFTSHSGMQLQGYRWVPQGEPVAVVQILHGVAEYALRYDAFARFLSGQGFLVVAHDHMGHGKSGGTPLHFPDGWAAVREDCHTIYELLRKEYPICPMCFSATVWALSSCALCSIPIRRWNFPAL